MGVYQVFIWSNKSFLPKNFYTFFNFLIFNFIFFKFSKSRIKIFIYRSFYKDLKFFLIFLYDIIYLDGKRKKKQKKRQTHNTHKITRSPYFLATSILAYFLACKIVVCRYVCMYVHRNCSMYQRHVLIHVQV